MDRAISASDANKRFSKMLRDVQNGKSYVVLVRGRPVARVIPVDRESQHRSVISLLEFLRTLPQRQMTARGRTDLYR